LPDDGGSAITDLEYQLDGGAWVSLAGTTTGAYPVSGLVDDQEYDVAIRAVNALGGGTASATKAVTPTSATLDFAFIEGKSQTTSSFAGVNFGAEDADRYIVVAIGMVDSGSNVRSFTSVTIGGVAATIAAVSGVGTNQFKRSVIAIAHVPTGLTGTVAVTQGGYNRFAIGVYRLVGLISATAYDSDSTTGNGNALPIDVPAGGVTIAAASFWGVTAFTWSGVAEDYDVSPGSQSQASTASKQSVSAETVSVDHSINNSGACSAAASFR
jgi:hypothetical protein